MAHKKYILLIDCETNIDDKVADFAAILVDRKGIIIKEMAVIIQKEFIGVDLFYDKKATGLWSYEYAKQKKAMYLEYLENGQRMMSSPNAINKWLNQVIGFCGGIENVELSAYNLAFDLSKCNNTSIDLSSFSNKFCLWQASVGNICNTRDYKAFMLENHLFNNKTQYGNMTLSTNAENVTSFLLGKMVIENHDALGDLRDFELAILNHIQKKRNWRKKITPYNWRAFQLKHHYVAK